MPFFVNGGCEGVIFVNRYFDLPNLNPQFCECPMESICLGQQLVCIMNLVVRINKREWR